jgi:hypothetical protein
MRLRHVVATVLCLTGCGLAAASPASAKLSADLSVSADGSATRLAATVSSDRALSARKRPTSLQLRLKGKVVVLARQKGAAPAGTVGSYRSPKLTGSRGAAARALIGKSVKLTAVTASGRSTVRTTARDGSAPGPTAGPTPTPAPAPTPAATPAPLFAKPASKLTGSQAYDAIKVYLADSTLTTCVAGWPNCSVEERYSVATDSTFRYCRLTPNSGSDINSVGAVTDIVGAEQEVDGSWGVSFREVSYSVTHQYTFRVAADGSASVQYWDGSTPFADGPNASYTGFTWVRGAKTCAY